MPPFGLYSTPEEVVPGLFVPDTWPHYSFTVAINLIIASTTASASCESEYQTNHEAIADQPFTFTHNYPPSLSYHTRVFRVARLTLKKSIVETEPPDSVDVT